MFWSKFLGGELNCLSSILEAGCAAPRSLDLRHDVRSLRIFALPCWGLKPTGPINLEVEPSVALRLMDSWKGFGGAPSGPPVPRSPIGGYCGHPARV